MTEEDKLYADELRKRALADYERLDHAIDELERQTCKTARTNLAESSQDCISRQEAISAIQDKYYDNATGIDIVDIVAHLPSVTPQPKRGKWICHRNHCENLGVRPSGLGVYEWCSNCDCGIDIREWQRNRYNFCPDCGADMKPYPQEEKPKRKAAIERQVIVSWYSPKEKTPDPDIIVQATISGTAKNIRFQRSIVPLLYCENEGWYSLDYDFDELTVHAWCDLEPYEGA